MKAKIELNSVVRSRDIQQFLNTASGDENKKLFIYNKNGKLFLTTDSTEASAAGKTRKELLASMKEGVKKSGYAGEVQALFKDIRNLAKPLRSANGHQNLFEDQSNYLTLTSGELTFLLKHRSDPRMLMSHESRGDIIDHSIRSLQKPLQKWCAPTATHDDNPNKTQKQGKAIGEKLASSLMSQFQKEKPFASPVEKAMFKMSFFTNDIEAVKESIRIYCSTELSQNISDEMLGAIASGLQESIENILPLSIKEFDSENSEPISLAEKLELGGKTYKLVSPECVGKGGHGVVHMYHNKSQPQEFIAVKSPVKCYSPLEIFNSNETTQNELTTHLRAQGIGHENVVEVKGAFMMAGKMCIALEDCSLGNLDSFVTKKLISHDDLTAGEIGIVLLTLGRDVLRGLDFLHTDSGIMHTDFKPQNIFVGADGKAKIGDFDRSTSGESATRDIHSVPDTPQYSTPSILIKTRQYRESVKKVIDVYDGKRLRDKDPTNRKEFAKERDRGLKLIDASVRLSQSDDIFSAGVTLYELYFGSNPFLQSESGSRNSLLVEQFGEMSTRERSDFLFEGKKIAPGLEQQEDEIKKMISGLMHPNSAKRTSVSEALASPIFFDSEIGSTETRLLIMQIGIVRTSETI